MRMELKMFQKGFNYSQDGSGNRLVYHLQGCNLHCPWCSNPEGMDAIGPETFTMTTAEILEEALRSRLMFFDGGGVTFTGGESTCQFPGLQETLTQLHGAGIPTCIETNGTSPYLSELFPVIDELIMDFKHPDSEYHRQITGRGNESIRQNIAKALAGHPNLLIRIPLVNGFNADPKTIEDFITFFRMHDTSHTRFEFLVYHEYGKDKWEKCGKPYTVTNGFVPEEIRRQYEKVMQSHGFHVVRT